MYATSGGETYLYKFGIASGRDSDDTAGGMAQGTVSLATGDASTVYVTAWDMLYRYCTVNVDDVTGFVADETVTLKDSDGANTKQAKVKYIDSSGDKLILDRESYGLRWLSNYKGGTVTLDSKTRLTCLDKIAFSGENGVTRDEILGQFGDMNNEIFNCRHSWEEMSSSPKDQGYNPEKFDA